MDTWRRRLAWRLAELAAAQLVGAITLQAQQGATIRGVVTDRSTARAVADAQINVVGQGRSVSSDSAGRYQMSGIPAGTSRVVVRAAGFPALRFDLQLNQGDTVVRQIQLDSTEAGRFASAQALPLVSVTAPETQTNYRLFDFERRRQTGRGQYLTEEQIVKSGAYTVADAVKSMRGVLYECGGSSCQVRMAQAPMRCTPEFIVDDQVMNDFGPTTPIRDIIGLEVYTGPAEVPGEYAGRYAGCGVIVIWTRSGPTRKRK
jgi:Carboxypeptidase regulatory-like domain